MDTNVLMVRPYRRNPVMVMVLGWYLLLVVATGALLADAFRSGWAVIVLVPAAALLWVWTRRLVRWATGRRCPPRLVTAAVLVATPHRHVPRVPP